jgi:hypothetical protein
MYGIGERTKQNFETVNNGWKYSALSDLLSTLTANTTDYTDSLHKLKRKKFLKGRCLFQTPFLMPAEWQIIQAETSRDWFSAANVSQQKLNKLEQTLSPCSSLLQAVLLLLYFILFYIWRTYYLNTDTLKNKSISDK